MRKLHCQIETVIGSYVKEIADYTKNGFHQHELQGKPASTATARSVFDRPSLNYCASCRPNGGADGFSFGTAPVNGGNPTVNTQPATASLFGSQAVAPILNPLAPTVPAFNVGAPAGTGYA